MPETTLDTLLLTAAFVGCIHTATGPDHFVPFIALARAGRWSLGKTMAVTTACGIGHVLGSVLLGLVGLAVGTAVARLIDVEAFRGNVAGWLLLGFGLAYMVWGLRRAWRHRPHAHLDVHPDGTIHLHQHAHDARQESVDSPGRASAATPWIVFLIFVFGPCEPLIPLLMYPAAKANLGASVLVATVFGLVTLSTMLVMVTAGYLGLARFAGGAAERYAHAACGGAIAMCGGAVCMGL